MRGGNNRKTDAQKRLEGTYRKDRAVRNTPRPKPAAVGEPPRSFTEAQKAAWLELAPQVEQVYTESDRASFCLLVKLQAMVDDPDALAMPPHAFCSLVRTVSGLLQQFGLTPASRGRVSKPGADEEEEEDPLDEFAVKPPKAGAARQRREPAAH